MVSDVLKPFEYYVENKKLFNRKYNRQWKAISYPEYVGSCSYLFQAFMKEWMANHSEEKPVYGDFFRYYLSHVNTETLYEGIKKPDCQRYGRTMEDLKVLAKHYETSCSDSSIPFERYFDDIVNHIIIETFNGQMVEILLKEAYEKRGYSVERTNGIWDKDCGVDMFIKDSNNAICEYIQVKPISAFLGAHNASLMSDRAMFFRKEEKKKKLCMENNYPYSKTVFILYSGDKPGKWASIDGKKGFHLEELCKPDGMPIHTMSDFSFVS